MEIHFLALVAINPIAFFVFRKWIQDEK